MRMIIAGGRDFDDYPLLEKKCRKVLKELLPAGFGSAEIVTGGARGADRLGEAFAREQKLKLRVFMADWQRLGRIAGFVRNEQMAVYASQGSSEGVLVAFWDGRSEGTANMIDLAFRYGLKVYVVNY